MHAIFSFSFCCALVLIFALLNLQSLPNCAWRFLPYIFSLSGPEGGVGGQLLIPLAVGGYAGVHLVSHAAKQLRETAGG